MALRLERITLLSIASRQKKARAAWARIGGLQARHDGAGRNRRRLSTPALVAGGR